MMRFPLDFLRRKVSFFPFSLVQHSSKIFEICKQFYIDCLEKNAPFKTFFELSLENKLSTDM
jgi:hypothetical protein